MSEALNKLNALPDINFVDKDVETLLTEAINVYEQTYFDETGEHISLAPGHPERIKLQTMALLLYQAYQKIEFTGRMNLLKYSTIDYTRNKGIDLGVTQNTAAVAVATVRFTISEIQESTIPIIAETLVTPGNELFFKTQEYTEISIGDLYADVVVECVEGGEIGNGYLPGQINTLVVPSIYISSVANTDTSQGGAEEESNESLKERIMLKPESFSTAGPEDAYKFFTKSYSSAIANVSVVAPVPGSGEIEIRFLLQDGEIPGETIRDEMLEFLSAKLIRPLTDQVSVPAPEEEEYDIDVTYYISTENRDIAASIQTEVDAAVDGYVMWQNTKFGRDINPSVLHSSMIGAGAKRVEVTDPVFTILDGRTVARDVDINVVYGGLEDE